MKNKIFITFIIMYAIMYTSCVFFQYDFAIAIKITIKALGTAIITTIIPFFQKKIKERKNIFIIFIAIYALMSTSVAFLQYDFTIAVKVTIKALGTAIIMTSISFFYEKIKKRKNIKIK